MADLPSVKKKINDIQVSANAPHSESLMVDIGSTENYLIDTTDDHETRISSLEGAASNYARAFITNGTYSGNSIIVPGSSVTINLKNSSNPISLTFRGGIISSNSGTINLSVRKNGTPTYSIPIPPDNQIFPYMNLIDLPLAVSVSYDLILSTTSANITFNNAELFVYEIK